MTTTEEGELPGEAARREQAEAERRERFRAGLRAGFGFGAAASGSAWTSSSGIPASPRRTIWSSSKGRARSGP